MLLAEIATLIDPGSILTGAQSFMNHGPLGLAGLLIVLVITTLYLGNVDGAKERVLRLVLFVGAFCFIAALVAQHFAPVPLPSAPPPDFSKQRAVLKNVKDGLANAEPKLQEVVQMASDAGACPGGGHGVPIPHGSDMATRSSAVIATLSAFEAEISSVVESLPSNNQSSQ
jgi:hypothetical protein